MVTKELRRMKLEDLVPYENNPRKNDEAVADVVASIQQCEDLDPIEVDEDFVILSGHTRLKALEQLGYDETDVMIYTGLTEQQKKKYRLLANKTGEKANWDWDLLSQELESVDFEGFDFGFVIPEELNWDDVPELKDNYKETEDELLECPFCHRTDRKAHFKSIKGVPIVPADEDEGFDESIEDDNL